jgi:sigma-B regulation protein RsbQ
VLFDHVGAAHSDASAYDREKYGSLRGYADDVLEILRALGLSRVVFVGHSVSAMIGVLAAAERPDLFDRLVLVGPRPGTSTTTATPAASAVRTSRTCSTRWTATTSAGRPRWPRSSWQPDRPELGAELTNSFCRTDPEIARHFARVTFLSDNRDDLAGCGSGAVLQCSDDVIAPTAVGDYVHRSSPGARWSGSPRPGTARTSARPRRPSRRSRRTCVHPTEDAPPSRSRTRGGPLRDMRRAATCPRCPAA